MINRRHLRIKVMQALYSYEQMNDHNISLIEKNLFRNIHYVYQLFLYQLYLVEKIAAYVQTDAQIRASKFLPTEEDKNFSTKLAENKIIAFLRESQPFNDLLKKEKLNYPVDEDLIKSLYNQLKKSDTYRQYLSKKETDISTDREIAIFLYKEVMLSSEVVEHYLEDLFPTWLDDRDIVIQTAINFIKNFSEENNTKLLHELTDSLSKESEEKKFAKDLLHATVLHEEEFRLVISPKLVNWDVDRIAQLDMILMKMALCEMLYFDSIPVKVSINEYIDISKLYSTPKSREFINGILDKLMRELKEAGKIIKKGRGLVE